MMSDRILTNVKFRNGVPISGHCNRCGRSFMMPADTSTDAATNTGTDDGKATRDFYKTFEQHKCDTDASQTGTHRAN